MLSHPVSPNRTDAGAILLGSRSLHRLMPSHPYTAALAQARVFWQRWSNDGKGGGGARPAMAGSPVFSTGSHAGRPQRCGASEAPPRPVSPRPYSAMINGPLSRSNELSKPLVQLRSGAHCNANDLLSSELSIGRRRAGAPHRKGRRAGRLVLKAYISITTASPIP